MILNPQSPEKLRLLINEETEYRSEPQLIQLFNNLGLNNSYAQGFPSRWIFTDEKLKAINGSPELDKCIKAVLSPSNFIGRVNDLDRYITGLSKHIASPSGN